MNFNEYFTLITFIKDLRTNPGKYSMENVALGLELIIEKLYNERQEIYPSFPVEQEECDLNCCDNCMYKGTDCDYVLFPFDNIFDDIFRLDREDADTEQPDEE